MKFQGTLQGLLLLLSPVSVLALGLRIGDQNPHATARGNAFAATADNPSAIYYNPAGLAQLEGHQVLAGVYGVTLESEYTAPDGRRSRTKDQFNAVPQLYYSVSLKRWPVSFGLGFYMPYGLGLEWPDNAGFRATRGRLEYLTVNPVAAWRLTPSLSAAAGLTLNYSETELKQTLFARPIFPPGGQIKFRGDGTDAGFNLGLLWRWHEKHSFGLSYRSATRIDFEGRSTTRGALLAGVPPTSQSAQAGFAFPQHWVAGWSYRPTPQWNLEFNLDWTDWDALNGVTLKQATGNAALPFDWKSSFFYEFGVTRELRGGWRCSGGYIYSENSVPERSFSPFVPDSDRHIFSLGLGRGSEQLRWDAAYQFAYGPERTVRNNQQTFPIGASANGRYEFFSHALTLSLSYAF